MSPLCAPNPAGARTAQRSVPRSVQRRERADWPSGRPRRTRCSQPRGFTLIELIIVVIVLGVLAAVALPSFMSVMLKSRRSDAVAAVTTVQQAMERFRANSPTYATTLATLGVPGQSPAGHYQVALEPGATATSYQIVATAVGRRAGDKRCARMTATAASGALYYGSSCLGCTPGGPGDDPNQCWAGR